jgi:hypothetical protein
MITPYIYPDKDIEEVPKEIKIRRIPSSHDEGPGVRDKKEKSYHYREKTRHESRVVESPCYVAKFLTAFSPVFDRIKDRIGDNK